jgi:hypothetical protein
MASITVVGTGFTGATLCFFGSQGVTISLNAAGTSFTCIPPAGVGGVTIGITGSNGTVSRASGYTYVGSPTITLLGVTNGSTGGGTFLHILGTNFYDRIGITFPGYYCGVSFGTVGVTADIYGITHCYVITPVSSVAGPVSIKLKTPTGVAIGLTFTYINYCSCVVPSEFSICNTGVTSSCFDDIGPVGRTGCNCCACCDAVCLFNPGCCDTGWAATLCGSQIVAEVFNADPVDVNNSIYKACKHLLNGSCCVKFNVAGLSYGVCLSPEGTSADCTALVSSLHAGNSGSPPWNQSYTYNFIQGGTCGSCNPFCKNSSCLTGIPGGITCQYGCGPCCSRFGFCDGNCECEFVAQCVDGYFWDDISCSCRQGINPFSGKGVGAG